MPDFSHIKHLLFDLGGVIYDIAPERTEQAFQRLLPAGSKLSIYSKTHQLDLISAYEVGGISTESFIREAQTQLRISADSEALIQAWNAMLIGIVPGRVAQLTALSKKFDLALLSNTNDLHLSHIYEESKPVFELMSRCFFSNQIGRRKPNRDCFEFVLAELGWEIGETLFIEDSPPNIAGAERIGLEVFPIHQLSDFELMASHLLAD